MPDFLYLVLLLASFNALGCFFGCYFGTRR